MQKPPASDAIRIGASGIYTHRPNADPLTRFQVLGERGCGTNVLRKAVEKNLSIQRTEALGWKHGFPTMPAIPSTLLVICVFRDARDWCRSLYARPWHGDVAMQRLSFSEFLRSDWLSIVDRQNDFSNLHPELTVQGEALQFDRHPITGQPFETIFAMRKTKAAALLGLVNRGATCAFLRYEAFRDAPEAVLAQLAERFDLTPRSQRYQPVRRRMGQRFNPTIKHRPAPPDQLNPQDLDFLRSHLDAKQESRLGYDYG